MKDYKIEAAGRLPMWPRVLIALHAACRPLTANEIGIAIQDDPRSAYAAMSSLGRQANRFWIRPLGHWNRKAEFEITARGVHALALYNQAAQASAKMRYGRQRRYILGALRGQHLTD